MDATWISDLKVRCLYSNAVRDQNLHIIQFVAIPMTLLLSVAPLLLSLIELSLPGTGLVMVSR